MRKKLFTFLLALAASVGMMNAAVDGKLPGAFSVSASQVVYFSQGNLQYTKSTGKWKIMDHQYDVVETLSQNVGTDYASQDVITLFGWGTSGWDNTAADATSVHYQPYSTCKTIHNSNANNNNYQYGPSNYNVVGSSKAASAESWSKSDSYKNYDWGVKNSSDLGSGWRVLTTQEWGYLFNTRTPGSSVNGVSNARYTEATINTDGTAVNGIILFPDDATLTTVSGVTWGTINGTSAWGTTCTTAGWEALEAAGCVFLPAAGYRDGTSVPYVGTRGFYWSSSAYSANYAYGLYFYSGSVGPQEINGRYDGCSVRLVSETAPSPAPANSCGDGLTWELNAGVFTISYDGVGTGVMDDFDYSEHPAPWQSSKESITSVIIPDGVTRIGNNAFSGAYNLASVSMSDDVVEIGNNAFEACNSLSSITLSSHVTTIGDHAFAGLQSLTSIVLPSTVQSIGTSAFYGNEGLTSITCEGTTPPTLGQYVFGMIGNGATLYVPYGYAETYESADSQWQALNIQVIGSGSASYPYCGDGLTWTYNNGVLTIIYDGVGTGDMLDYGNYNIVPWDSYKDDITSVIIPDGVIRIGNYAFANLTNLASVSMGDDVVEIGYGGFWNCLSIQSITLGSHVTTIGEHAFGSNQALTSITLPNTLQTIGGSAFYNCNSLPTITIPSSVTSFGDYAFGFCEGLTSFTCEGTTPPTLGQDVFTMVPYYRPLYVPAGYVETYQGADSQWQKFDISIIPGGDPTPDPEPTPSATGVIFANCYDCWRSPDYPKISGQCYLHSFADPRVGNNKPSGPWKLEFVENYNSSSTEYDSDIVKNAVASEYYKSPAEMEVYRLYQWQNGAYQPVAYGVLYAYANENNQVEHAAFFEADGFWGCYLTDNTHSNGDNINILFNEDASTGFADLHPAPTPTPDPEPTPSGDGDKLAGAFSVGGDKVVYFSKANLQATTADNGATWTWGFAANQWDYVGNNAANNAINGGGTVSTNGAVDLFAWSSTDNNYFGINNSINEADYSGDFKDWGAKKGSDWRTLTINEWQYLLQERNPGSSSANHTNYPRYTNAQILTDGTAPQMDIKGIILFPDDFNDGGESIDGVTWGSINPSFYSSYPTYCTTAGWATLESMGCVFLPSAGSRQNFGDEFAILDVNQMGNYWSSTLYSGEPEDPQSIAVGDGTLGIGTTPRYFGMSVRLVSENAPGGSTNPEIKLYADFGGDWADTEAFTDNGDGTATLTIPSLEAKHNAIFVKKDGVQMSSGHNFTRENPSADVSGNQLAMWFDTDEAGEYTFTFEYSTNILTITYPTATPTPAPSDDANKLPGAFSVSGTKVVYFSKGNLQATTADNGNTWTWGFAENQYDVIGDAVANNAINGGGTVSQNGAVDLFGWSSTDNNYYGIDNSADLTDYDGNFQDWGAKVGSDWHALNGAQWEYLLLTREPGSLADGTSNPRFTRATILTDGTAPSQDIFGLILFPDNFNDGGEYIDGVTWNGINSHSSYVSPTYCTTAGWATLESMGCVFLPAPGWRSGNEVTNVGAFGIYWSSTKYSEEDASCIYFSNTDVAAFHSYITTGASVRLVSETAPSGGSTPEPSETTVTWDLSDMASMGTQGGYFKAKGITLMAYGVDNGMSGDGSYGGAFFGGPFVFTTSLGKFTKIEVTNSYLYDQPAFSGDGWTLDGTNAVWEGTPAALVSLVSNFGGITQIKFTIDPNTSTPANSCGDGLTWTVNDGVLTISYDGVGTGSMDNYDDPLSMPWFGQNITSVVLPEGLISIGQNAFAFINTFSQITLPSTLQYILMNAFSGCGLTSVTIPENVKGISASAFISSQSLATVTFEPTTPPRVGGNAFENCHSDLIIYYPCESRAQYYNDMQADIAYYHDKMYNCPAPTPANPVIKLNANFGGTYDWADTEAFTDNGDGTATLSNIALTAGYYYNFNVNVGDVWFHNNYEFTRQNPSYVINSSGEGVYYFQADVTGNYSFTWEYATNTLTIGYPHTYTAVGHNLAIFGNSWDASITDNDLVLQEDGSYKWEKENVSFTGASTIQYRVCKDHAWDVAYPATSEQPATFEIPSLGDYKITITYNPVGNVISASAEKIAKPTIQLNGNFSGEWADTEEFEVVEQPMDSYAKLTKLLEPGTYEFGVKVNGEWRANGSAYTRDNYSYIIEEGQTGNLTINVDVKGYYSFFWYYDNNRLIIDYSRVCGMYWKDVTAGNFEVTLGQEGEVTLPKVWATSMAFAYNIFNGVDQVRLGSTDETVATIAYTLSEDGLGTLTFHQAGECDIYVVHDITNLYCYDSCAFHLTVHPAAPVVPVYTDADFAIDFRNDPYQVTSGSLPTGTEVEGTPHSDISHGYTNAVITIPVTAGNYKVMMGTCSYSNQDATIKTEDNSYTYATLETNNGTCYHQNTATNVVGAIFNVPSDQIIKVYGAEYTPYFSIKKMPEIPAFTDFELNFQTDPYNEISGAKPAGTVIAGSFHDGQHGYQNVEATVPVKAGKYRLTLGACGYGNGAGNVMSETNVELASFNQKLAEESMCYVASTGANTVSVIFDVDKDQTITIDCGQYTPYMKLEAVTSYAVEFALGDAEGTAPTAVDVTVGNELTMPVNKTMYKEGYTLTGWSDGVNTYAIGNSFTPTNDVVLTPVFTANEADLLSASTDVTVKWYFGGDNGAPVMHLEGSAGLLVAKATIGDKTVDVKLAIDATSGKFVPQPTTEWAQVGVGTIFTYPYKEGMTVNVDNYKSYVTYYIADAEGKVTCGENDYYSFIEVTYPASAPTTAVVIGDPNDADQVTAFLNTYDGHTIDELIIDRPVLNNMYNTLCLPFDMDANQIANSSLNGVEIREFTGASVEGTTLNLSVGDPVNAVVAGRPYFVKYSAASQLDDLHFEDVTINNALLDNMAVTFDGVTFKGTFTPFVMPNGLNFQGGYLFLGQNNQLFWPNTPNPLKPFRAYFYVDVESSTPGNAPKYRGMPARIVEGKNVATGVENAQSANQSTKVIVNGQLIIIKNDVRYNAQGQIVK